MHAEFVCSTQISVATNWLRKTRVDAGIKVSFKVRRSVARNVCQTVDRYSLAYFEL
jgi:hypothetical protein